MQGDREPEPLNPVPRTEELAPSRPAGPAPRAAAAGRMGRRGAGLLIAAAIVGAIGIGAVATGVVNVPGLRPSPQISSPMMSQSEDTAAEKRAQVTKTIGALWIPLTPQAAKARNLKTSQTEGYVITDIASPSPAESAGLRVNDIVLAIDGVAVGADLNMWNVKTRMTAIGGAMQLSVERNGAIQQMPIRVGRCNATPAQRDEYTQATKDARCPVWAREAKY